MILLCGQTIFIVYIKTDAIYKDIAEDVETRFEIRCRNYELDRKVNDER